MLLVFKDFARLVLWGNIIAIPLLYLGSQEWLNQFAFRINFNWIIPLFSIALSLVFAFVFSFFNILKLARINPVEILKSE